MAALKQGPVKLLGSLFQTPTHTSLRCCLQKSPPVFQTSRIYHQYALRTAFQHPRRPFHSQTQTSAQSPIDKKIDSLPEKDLLYELSLTLSRTPMNANAEVQCIFYDEAGSAKGNSRLSKQQIAEKYNLNTRDLRTIDLPSSGFPHILIRDNAILVHMFDLRLLVQANQVVLFDVDEDIGREHNDNNSRIFSYNLEDKLHYGHGSKFSPNLPYELRVLETAFTSVTSTLEAKYLIIKKEVSETLATLHNDAVVHAGLRKLLEQVRKLSTVEQRATQIRNAVQDILNEDQDMADMYLTDKLAGRPHAIEDHQSVEYLLEAVQKASDAVVQQSSSLLGEIRRTEETVQSILNVRRNQIMVLEAKIEILMVGLASATLVAGWYGMNVINYSEESAWAFGVLTTLCLVATGLIWRAGARRLRTIQNTRI